MPLTLATPQTHQSSGGRLVTADGQSLPLRAMNLATEAGGGLARCRLTQTFANTGKEPLTVTYQLPLPADAAVSAFAFRLGDRRIVGEIDRREAARERFETALAQGRSAAILDQERQSLFTQEIGNIPPGAEVVAEITVDQHLLWQGEGWEWRFPTCVAPRYLGEPGRVPDAERVTVDVTRSEVPPRLQLQVTVRDALAASALPTSPSHALRAVPAAAGVTVTLAEDRGAALDRDVVVRWSVAEPQVGATVVQARAAADRKTGGSAHGLLTLVPPEASHTGTPVARDMVVLLDISGSMSGEPLAQARAVVGELVRSLTARDQLEMIAFASAPTRWRSEPVAMTEAAQEKALSWLRSLQAGGSTEMRAAIVAALAPLHAEHQRQVVLVTDGMIGFEREIVAEIQERLPAGSRVHTVGVGSAVNRALTACAARAGRGLEVIVGLGEDPAPAARRVLARTKAPLVVDLSLSGSALRGHAPRCLPDLFAAAPALLALELAPEGGQLTVRGRTASGTFERTLAVAATAPATGRQELVALFGREVLEDLEMQRGAARDCTEVDARIERVALDYQLSSRRTSWIAVSEEPTVDPKEPMRRVRVPHELAHGLSVDGLGLRAADSGVAYLCAGSGATFAAPASAARMPMARKVHRDQGDADVPLEAPRRQPPMSPEPKKSAEPTPPPVSPRRPSLWEALVASVRALLGGKAPAGPLACAGRIRVFDQKTLVVEFEPPAAWQIPGRLVLRWADGTELAARVDVGGTTRAGALAAGQHARLSLKLDAGAPADAPVQLALQVGQDLWVMSLRS